MLVPDAIEPAVGYRAWRVGADGLLHSVTMSAVWEPDKPYEAECGSGREHECPDPKCTCGCYAAATFNRLFSMGYAAGGYGWYGEGTRQTVIVGTVSMWGIIIPGQHGWRAQYAYPKKLLIPYSAYKLLVPLKEKYGVPAQLFNALRKH